MEVARNQGVSDNTLDLSLIFFSLMFYHPYKTNKIVRKINQICYLSSTFIFSIATLVLWFIEEHTLYFIAEFIWNFGLVFLVASKYLPLVVWEKKLIKLIELRPQFWCMDGHGKEFDDEIYSLLKVTNGLIRFYMVSLYSCLILAEILPFYSDNGLMAIGYYTESTYYYLLFIDWYYAYMLANWMASTTTILLSNVTDLIIQFRIIKKVIKDRQWTDKDENLKELKRIIAHYRFLEDYMNEMKDVLLSPFIGLYFSTMVTTCVETYNLLESETNLVYKLKASTYVVSMFLQMACYCIPIYELVTEIRELSTAWYMSKWVDATDDFKKMVPFLMMQTQHIQDFKALSFITINNIVIIDVFKTMMSYLTFMKKLKK